MSLVWAHLAIVGLAADVAGAIVLALSFSAKRPEAMREEVPEGVEVRLFPGSVTVPFPQALLTSLIRQRAEARLGLVLLVGGFLLQGANTMFDLGGLTAPGQRVVALLLMLITWLVAYVAWRLYVPWDERRGRAAVDAHTRERNEKESSTTIPAPSASEGG